VRTDSPHTGVIFVSAGFSIMSREGRIGDVNLRATNIL